MKKLLLVVLCVSIIGIIAWAFVRRTNSYKAFRKQFRHDFGTGCRKAADLLKGVSARGPKGQRNSKEVAL